MFDFDEGIKRDSIFKEKEEGNVQIKLTSQDVLDLLSILLTSLSVFEESAKTIKEDGTISSMLKARYSLISSRSEDIYLKISAQYQDGMPNDKDIIN